LRTNLNSRPSHEQRLAGLLNGLSGRSKQRRRHGQAQRLRRLRIDDKLEAGGLLNRQISHFRAPQNVIKLGCSLPEQIDVVDSVAQEPTLRDKIPVRIDRR
jgi:hypothetical protein